MTKNKKLAFVLFAVCLCLSLGLLVYASIPSKTAKAEDYIDQSELLSADFSVSAPNQLRVFSDNSLKGYYYCASDVSLLQLSNNFTLSGTNYVSTNEYTVECLTTQGTKSATITKLDATNYIFDFTPIDYGTYSLRFKITDVTLGNTYTSSIIIHALPGAYNTDTSSYNYTETWLFAKGGNKYDSSTYGYAPYADFDYPYYMNDKTFYVDAFTNINSDNTDSIIEYERLEFQLVNLNEYVSFTNAFIVPDNLNNYSSNFSSYFSDASYKNIVINLNDIKNNEVEQKQIILNAYLNDSLHSLSKEYIETIDFEFARIYDLESTSWNVLDRVGTMVFEQPNNYKYKINNSDSNYIYDFALSKTNVSITSLEQLNEFTYNSVFSLDDSSFTLSNDINGKTLSFTADDVSLYFNQDAVGGGEFYLLSIAYDCMGKRVGYKSLAFDLSLSPIEITNVQNAITSISNLLTAIDGVPVANYGDHLSKFIEVDSTLDLIPNSALVFVTNYNDYLPFKEKYDNYTLVKAIENNLETIKSYSSSTYFQHDELINLTITLYNSLEETYKNLVSNSSIIIDLTDYINSRTALGQLSDLSSSFDLSSTTAKTSATQLYKYYNSLSESQKEFVNYDISNAVFDAIMYLERGVNSLTLDCGECINLTSSEEALPMEFPASDSSFMIKTDNVFMATGLNCSWLISSNEAFQVEENSNSIFIFPTNVGSGIITAYYTTLNGDTYRDDVRINVYDSPVNGSFVVDNSSDIFTTFDTLEWKVAISNGIVLSSNASFVWKIDDVLQTNTESSFDIRFSQLGMHKVECIVTDAATGIDSLSITKTVQVEIPSEYLVGKLSITKDGEGAYTTYDTLKIVAELDYGTQLSDNVTYSWAIDGTNLNFDTKSISYRFLNDGAHEIVCTINDTTYDISDLKITRSVSISAVTDAEFTLSLNYAEKTYAYLKGNEIILTAYLDGFVNNDYTYSWEIFDQSVLKYYVQPSGGPEIALTPLIAGESTVMVRVDTGRYESKILMKTIKIIVFDTIESLQIFRSDSSLKPGADVSYTASANDLNEVCNLNISWDCKLDGETDIVPTEKGNTITLSALEKGKYKVTASIMGISASDTFKIQAIPLDKILYSLLPIIVICAIIAIVIYMIYKKQKPKLFILYESINKTQADIELSVKKFNELQIEKNAKRFILGKFRSWKHIVSEWLIFSRNLSLEENLDMEIGERNIAQLMFIIIAAQKSFKAEFDREKINILIENICSRNLKSISDFINQKINTVKINKEKQAVDTLAELDHTPKAKKLATKYHSITEYTEYLRKLNYYDADQKLSDDDDDDEGSDKGE